MTPGERFALIFLMYAIPTILFVTALDYAIRHWIMGMP